MSLGAVNDVRTRPDVSGAGAAQTYIRLESDMAHAAHHTVAKHLADALAIQGVNRVFCVPGESYIAVLDALADYGDEIDLVTCRQEGGAAMMAEADAKLTGRPGICMVTRGPGATNASAGLQVAFQDSTPMILFIGQVGIDFAEREAFQEIDYRRMFGQLAKWVAQVDSPARIHEFVARAFSVAMSGRPGPVVLALPEDILTEIVEAAPAARREPVEIHPSREQVQQVNYLICGAKAPMMIVGGSRWSKAASENSMRFADSFDLPVAASFRRQDYFDNAHRCYIGELGLGPNPKLAARVRNADVLLVLGTRLGEIASNGFRLLDIPEPQQTLIHVLADVDELGRIYSPSLAINATPAAFTTALVRLSAPDRRPWGQSLESTRQDYDAWQIPRGLPGQFNLGQAIVALREALPPNTIFTNGAGNFSAFLHRYHRYRDFGTQLAPTSGSMGYGVPAAVAAKLRHPDRPVICLAGDGDFLMTGQELATARQYGAAPIFIVIDNGMYGTIRMHQERNYPGRVWGTSLQNPDFVRLGEAYGASAKLIERTDELLPAVTDALSANRLTLLHVKVDPDALSPGQTISEIRGKR